MNALEVWLPIHILKTKTTPAQEERLKDLLQQADCPVDGPTPGQDVDEAALEELLSDDAIEDEPEFEGLLEDEVAGDTEEETGDDEEVLVLEITPGCAEDDDVDKEIRRCTTSGGTVIGIWPPNGEPRGTVPEALDRLGGGLVEWSPERVRDAIVRGDLPWLNSDGSARQKKNIKRNRC